MSLEMHIKTSVVLTLKKEIYTCSFVVSSIQLLEKTDSSAKNTVLVGVVQPEKVLLIYTLFHNKIHSFLGSVT